MKPEMMGWTICT